MDAGSNTWIRACRCVVSLLLLWSKVPVSKGSFVCTERCNVCFWTHTGLKTCADFANFDDALQNVPVDVNELLIGADESGTWYPGWNVYRKTFFCKTSLLRDESFVKFKGMRSLKMNLCNVQRIDANSLSGLKNIEDLQLILPNSDHYFKNESCSETFSLMEKLTSLTVSGINFLLCDVSTLVISKPRLSELRLYNLILSVHKPIKHEVLRTLDLSYSDLFPRKIPDPSGLPNLEEIALNYTTIYNFSIDNPFAVKHIRLVMDSAQRTQDEVKAKEFDNYATLNSIEIFFQYNMQFTVEEGCFNTLARNNVTVRKLEITFSSSYYPTVVNQLSMTTLQRLLASSSECNVNTLVLTYGVIYLKNNDKAIALSKSFNVSSLRHLDLSFNSLLIIPDFVQLLHLESLRLQFCGITDITENAFQHLMQLRYLDLTGNKLTAIRLKPFTLFKKLPETLETLVLKMTFDGAKDFCKGRKNPVIKNAIPSPPPIPYTNINFPNLRYLDLSETTLVGGLMIKGLVFQSMRHLVLQRTTMCINKPDILIYLNQTLESLTVSGSPYILERILETLNTINTTWPALRKIDMSENSKYFQRANKTSPFLNKLFFLKMMPGIETVNLSFNSLSDVNKLTFKPVPNLKTLDLSNNQLVYMDPHIFQNLRAFKFLNISQNKFKCDCDLRPFRDMLNRSRFHFEQTLCYYPTSLKNQLISNYSLPFIACDHHLEMVIALAVVGLVLASVPIPALIAYYRLNIKYWWYFGRRRAGYRPLDGDVHRYDAFVCYSKNELGWVVRELVEELENGPNERFQLCIHDRDFDLGGDIIENITRSINCSRRVIFVLSREFIRSYWGTFELNLALMEAIEKRRKFVILIFYENIPKKEIPRHLQCFMRHVTYASWPQHVGRAREMFWMKLKLALRNRGVAEENI